MSSRLEITMKSGAVVNVDVETWKLETKVLGARSLEWTTPKNRKRRRLVSFEFEEVAAIVEVLR